MRSQRMFGFINQIVILLMIFPFPLHGQEVGGLHEKLYRSEKSFSMPGQKCNEQEAEKKFNDLMDEHKDFDLIPLKDLDNVAKLICVGNENFEVICSGGKCKCSKPTHVWDLRNKKCSMHYGSACESGDDCVAGLICSNTVGPQLKRKLDGEYIWKNQTCMKTCIRERCNSRNVNCTLDAHQCKEVIECQGDPFDVQFECIAECNKCFHIEDFNEKEICKENCRSEVMNYKTSKVHQDCDNKCRRDENINGCTDNCLDVHEKMLSLNVQEACPINDDQEKCLECVNKEFSSTTYEKSISRPTCNSFCDPKNKTIEQCAGNCKTLCELQRVAQHYMNCYSICEGRLDTEKNVLCHIECFNSKLRVKYNDDDEECKSECDVSKSDPCKQCYTTCRASIKIQIKQKRISIMNQMLPQLCQEHCEFLGNPSCVVCNSAVIEDARFCRASCNSKSTLLDCKSQCKFTCKTILEKIDEAEAYKDCYHLDKIGTCYKDKFKKNMEVLRKNQDYMVYCENVCYFPASATISNCSSRCEELCNKKLTSYTDIYCTSKMNGFCSTPTPCDGCHQLQETECQKSCTPKNMNNTIQCRDECLDLCEAERPFIDPFNTRLKLCELYCERPKTSPCTKRCFEYCKVTSKNFEKDTVGRCECSKDPSNPHPKKIPKPQYDVCRKCRSNYQRNVLDSCKNDVMRCKPRIEADPSGDICFTQCNTECIKSITIITKSKCEKDCNLTSGCEQKCIDKIFSYAAIVRLCLNQCFARPSEKSIGIPYICDPTTCLITCSQKPGFESVRSCLNISQTKCTQIDQPPFLSEYYEQTNCPSCNVDVRLVNLRQCRDRCAIPEHLINYMRPLTVEETKMRDKTCSLSCQATCLQQQFPILSYDCHKISECPDTMEPTKRLECVIECCKKSIHSIVNTICPNSCNQALESNVQYTICPNCTDYCYGKHQIDFFHASAKLKCSTCKDEDPSECDICKGVLITPKCPDCPIATCATDCESYCLKAICVKNTHLLYQKTDETYLKKCVVDTKPTNPGCATKCSNDCPKTCVEECNQVHLLQNVCYGECNSGFKNGTIINTRQSVGYAVRRPLPTRKPGPYNYEEYWCCYNNGNSQCNASNPRKNKNKNYATTFKYMTQLNKCICILVASILVLIQ